MAEDARVFPAGIHYDTKKKIDEYIAYFLNISYTVQFSTSAKKCKGKLPLKQENLLLKRRENLKNIPNSTLNKEMRIFSFDKEETMVYNTRTLELLF